MAPDSKKDSRKAMRKSILDLRRPLYSVDRNAFGTIVTAGGGGAAKTGIQNEITLLRWSAENPEELEESTTKDTESIPCNLIAFHPLKQVLLGALEENVTSFTIDKDYNIKASATHQVDFAEENANVKAIRFIEGGRQVITAGGDGTVRIWRFPSFSLVKSLLCGETAATSLDIEGGGENVAVTYRNRNFCVIFNLSTSRHRRVTSTSDLYMRCARYSFSGLYVGELKPKKGCKLTFWNADKLNLLGECVIDKRDVFTAMELSINNELIGFGMSDGRVKVVHAESLRQVMCITPHAWTVTSLVFTSNSQQIITTSLDRTCCINPVKIVTQKSSTTPYLLLALLVLLLALVYQYLF